ncbi:MAG: hypothetical protein DDT29_01074 [Dehalococcoidia bacterium]|nr:hypothetical protein [Bacillota bacterium]
MVSPLSVSSSLARFARFNAPAIPLRSSAFINACPSASWQSRLTIARRKPSELTRFSLPFSAESLTHCKTGRVSFLEANGNTLFNASTNSEAPRFGITEFEGHILTWQKVIGVLSLIQSASAKRPVLAPQITFSRFSVVCDTLALPLWGITLTTLLSPNALRYPRKPLRPRATSFNITLSATALERAFTSTALCAMKPSPERLPSIFNCSRNHPLCACW